METLESERGKVYRLDIGDYYSFIDYRGYRILFGVSNDLSSLMEATVSYCRKYLPKHSRCEVSVIDRPSLGVRPHIVSHLTSLEVV